MRRHILGQTGIEVSALGYGCAQLTAAPDRQQAVGLLESAFAGGITHFDVARGYGLGRAEGILAEFLSGKRESVTVATKFGLQPPSGLAGNQQVIDLAKRFLRPFPRLLQCAKNHGSTLVTSGIFTPAAAVESLETSLRELKTSYVDFFFLHEATVGAASNQELIEALLRQREQGKVRALGIASAFSKVRNDVSLLPSCLKVIQFDDDTQVRNLPKLANRECKDLIVHSIFKPFRHLRAATQAFPELVREYSAHSQLDLSDPQTLGSLLLHHSLDNGADAVLFSSSNHAHIAANICCASTQRYERGQLETFANFVENILKRDISRASQEREPA